jgi:cytochrome c-type biogenesis protein CcmF
MKFIGESLLPGQLGHFFILLSFIASLVATVAYFKATTTKLPADKDGWKRLARIAFITEIFSVVSIFAILFYIVSNHLFEYKYAWQHSSRSLQMEYLLSCFWEGQEGSFLLWTFWHAVLGGILIRTAKNWESPVMTVVSFAQFCLATMILGMFFFGAKVGSNPFILLRNSEFGNGPIFAKPEYLSFIKDGNGLNPLLQNYWMVIHPPVLFLGFASVLIPFAYAVAGLWQKDYSGWIKPGLPWALFSGGIFGLGIMMGAAWAYESLTFGGYWAWDPVENASMVPWMVMISGIHTMLIYKHSGYSLRSSFVFILLSFILVLYSTFLTRSGVLGDSSVHAFTDLGMNFQLLSFVLVFLIPSIILYLKNRKAIPTIIKEEKTYSREFWMFIGALIFFLSAVLIIGQTSVPIYNKIFDKKNALGDDPEFSYNRIQIFVAVVIGILSAVTQYFKYKDTPKAYFRKKIWLPTLIALLASAAISAFGHINYDKHGIGFLAAIHLAIFAAVYSIVANATYIWKGLKGKMAAAGASIAHVGFGLMLLGILISSSKKTVLSYNTTGFSPLQVGEKESPMENISLVRGQATDMGKYMVTYNGNYWSEKENKRFYVVDFKSKDGKDSFTLKPDVIPNKNGEGMTPNPDSKHYLHKDIFSYLTYVIPPEAVKDTAQFRDVLVKPGDTVFYSNGFLVLNNVLRNPTGEAYAALKSDATLVADIRVQSKTGSAFKAAPVLYLQGQSGGYINDTIMAESLVLQFKGVDENPASGKIKLAIKESKALQDLITLKVYEFPHINVLWLGIIVMIIGFFMSMVRRIRMNK